MEGYVDILIICGILSLFIFVLYALDKTSRPIHLLEWATASVIIGSILGGIILTGRKFASLVQEESLPQFEINLAFHTVSMLTWFVGLGSLIVFVVWFCGEEIRWRNIHKTFTACIITTVVAVAAIMTSEAVRDHYFEKPIEIEPIERIYFEDN